MDSTEASDAFNAGSIPVECIFFVIMKKTPQLEEDRNVRF